MKRNAVTHVFNKDLLSTYYEPGTNIVLWISVVSIKKSKIMEFILWWREMDNKQVSKICSI